MKVQRPIAMAGSPPAAAARWAAPSRPQHPAPASIPPKTYFTIQIRFPKNTNGVLLTPEASGNLTDFGTGTTQHNPYGPPIDDGLFTTQSYYMTPGTAATPTSTGSGFCRIRATR